LDANLVAIFDRLRLEHQDFTGSLACSTTVEFSSATATRPATRSAGPESPPLHPGRRCSLILRMRSIDQFCRPQALCLSASITGARPGPRWRSVLLALRRSGSPPPELRLDETAAPGVVGRFDVDALTRLLDLLEAGGGRRCPDSTVGTSAINFALDWTSQIDGRRRAGNLGSARRLASSGAAVLTSSLNARRCDLPVVSKIRLDFVSISGFSRQPPEFHHVDPSSSSRTPSDERVGSRVHLPST